jgi:hypothetical protein
MINILFGKRRFWLILAAVVLLLVGSMLLFTIYFAPKDPYGIYEQAMVAQKRLKSFECMQTATQKTKDIGQNESQTDSKMKYSTVTKINYKKVNGLSTYKVKTVLSDIDIGTTTYCDGKQIIDVTKSGIASVAERKPQKTPWFLYINFDKKFLKKQNVQIENGSKIVELVFDGQKMLESSPALSESFNVDEFVITSKIDKGGLITEINQKSVYIYDDTMQYQTDETLVYSNFNGKENFLIPQVK